MNQRDLNREVSKKTGETVAVISALGFVPLQDIPYEREPLAIDWDELHADRNVAVMLRQTRPPVVA